MAYSELENRIIELSSENSISIEKIQELFDKGAKNEWKQLRHESKWAEFIPEGCKFVCLSSDTAFLH